MATNGYGRLIKDGLWNNNQALVALLGLCPLLAVTNSAVNGLGLGFGNSGRDHPLQRDGLSHPQLGPAGVRLPVFVLVIASFVTAVELSMNAWFLRTLQNSRHIHSADRHQLRDHRPGQAFASKNPLGRSLVDGLAMGIGFTLVLTVLGAVREIIGLGTIFAQADLMFGDIASGLKVNLSEDFGVCCWQFFHRVHSLGWDS